MCRRGCSGLRHNRGAAPGPVETFQRFLETRKRMKRCPLVVPGFRVIAANRKNFAITLERFREAAKGAIGVASIVAGLGIAWAYVEGSAERRGSFLETAEIVQRGTAIIPGFRTVCAQLERTRKSLQCRLPGAGARLDHGQKMQSVEGLGCGTNDRKAKFLGLDTRSTAIGAKGEVQNVRNRNGSLDHSTFPRGKSVEAAHAGGGS